MGERGSGGGGGGGVQEMEVSTDKHLQQQGRKVVSDKNNKEQKNVLEQNV